MIPSVKDILANIVLTLKHRETPRLDVELILSRVLHLSRTQLLASPMRILSPPEYSELQKLFKRLEQGEPVAYILGEKEFWSMRLTVTPDVLIPRPETELLVELALEKLPKQSKIRLLEIGTGSGAIALALAKERPHWEIMATDISEAALKIARSNAEHFRFKNIEFRLSDLFSSLQNEQFDVVISNPPYVDENDFSLNQPPLIFEPSIALRAKRNGLETLFSLIDKAKKYLKKTGWIFLEHGNNQKEIIQKTLENKGFFDISTYLDLAGNDRVTIARANRS